jgi:AcrR family transcriptional regulator
METIAKGLPGRKQEAARNDATILVAAREVFLNDASATMAAVSERAGVGIGALYRRYPNKEALLRQLCYDGLRQYNAVAEEALAESDGWQTLTHFLEHVVEADVHSLTVKLAGLFTPDEEIAPDVERSAVLTSEIVSRAHASGRLRPDFTDQDVPWVMDACAAISHPNAKRTTELRRRCLAVLIDGLTVRSELPGPAPVGADYAWRWERRR